MPPLDELTSELEAVLTERYGLMLPSRVLWKLLGYPSTDAWRKAIQRKTIPVPIFKIPERSGYFALSRDVAVWIAKARMSGEESTEGGSPCD